MSKEKDPAATPYDCLLEAPKFNEVGLMFFDDFKGSCLINVHHMFYIYFIQC